jgi:isopenicillin N synthase-like dioxygenase
MDPRTACYFDGVTFRIPTIDLSGWWAGDATDRSRIALTLDQACRTVGFAQLVGHGIAPEVIADMRSTSDAFFDLPIEQKLDARSSDLAANRGYSATGSEGLAYSVGDAAPPDLFEAFNIGDDDVDADDPFYGAERHRLFAPNIWPAEPAGLRRALTTYFGEACRVALAVTDVFAPALGLPDGWFRPFVDRSTTTMRTINYQRRDGEPSPADRQLRMGGHTDYGVVTLLWADDNPGLEILGADGEWHSVLPDQGALLMNLGDLTAEWTNDRWRSTMHRVVPPGDSTCGPARRRSTAFFFDANWSALIECVPTCTDSMNPPRYPPVVAGDHLMAKLMGPRTLRPSDAVDTASDRLGR